MGKKEDEFTARLREGITQEVLDKLAETSANAASRQVSSASSGSSESKGQRERELGHTTQIEKDDGKGEENEEKGEEKGGEEEIPKIIDNFGIEEIDEESEICAEQMDYEMDDDREL